MRRQLREFRLQDNEQDRTFLQRALDQYQHRHDFATQTNYGYTFGHMWIVRDIAKYHPTKQDANLAQDMDDRLANATAV